MALSKNTVSNPLICKVEYVPVDDIQSMEDVELHQVKITLKNGKAYLPVYGTPASFTFSEPVEQSAAGLLHKQKVSVSYPGINSSVQQELIELERTKLVVLVTYQHGSIQVIGSLLNPAKCFNSFGSSEATGCTLTFACDNDERARFLTT